VGGALPTLTLIYVVFHFYFVDGIIAIGVIGLAALVGSILYATTKNPSIKLGFLFFTLLSTDFLSFTFKDLSPTLRSFYFFTLIFSFMMLAGLTLSLFLGVKR